MATNSLSKPAFPPLQRSQIWIQDLIKWAKSPPRMPSIPLGRGFKPYLERGTTSEMLDLFEAICALTMGIEQYLIGQPDGLSLAEIARARGTCQNRLLSLAPPSDVTLICPKMACGIYEAVKWTAWIYGIAVIFPIPRSFNAFKELAQRQRTAIELWEIDSHEGNASELLLWMLMLGGIAVLDQPEGAWFVDRLVGCSLSLDIQDWAGVEEVMGKFLWLSSACGPSGRYLWKTSVEKSGIGGDYR